jgi:hypothetical protein
MLEERAQRFEEHRLVVDEQHTDRHSHRRAPAGGMAEAAGF